MRTDENRNPTAFTTDLAKEARLILGVDYVQGTGFLAGSNPYPYYTAHILGDPIDVTRRLIDAVTFYTHAGSPRWTYIALPQWAWKQLNPVDVIGYMYMREGGREMRHLFPNYGAH